MKNFHFNKSKEKYRTGQMKIKILLITFIFILIAFIFFASFYLLRSTISISSNQSGANVYINGRFVGTTPYKRKAFKGKYDVRISKDGFEEYSTNVDLKGSKSETFSANLEKLEYLLLVRQNKFYKMSSDGKVVKQLGESADGNPIFISFFPDGRKILFEIESSSYKNSIWIMDVDGSNRKNLTGDLQVSGRDFPLFFPSEKKILFTTPGSNKGYVAFWTIDIDSGNRKKVIEVKSEHEEIRYAISPDGSKILFYGFDLLQNLGPTTLWIVDSTGKNLMNITKVMNGQGKVTAASFSPDENKILFAFSGNLLGEKWTGLWVTDLDGKNIKKIGKGITNEYGFSSLKFSSDGKRVFFISDGGCLCSAYIDGAGEEIVTAAVSDFYFFQNEEKILLLTSQFHLDVINTDGTREKEIRERLGNQVYLDYIYIFGSPISPNGRKVLCSISSNSESYPYVLGLDSGKLIKLNNVGICGWFPDPLSN